MDIEKIEFESTEKALAFTEAIDLINETSKRLKIGYQLIDNGVAYYCFNKAEGKPVWNIY